MRDVLRQIPFFHERVAPYSFQQFLLGYQTVGVLSEKEQDVERFRGQRNRRIRARQSARTWIQNKLSEAVQVIHRNQLIERFRVFHLFSELPEGLPRAPP